MQTEETIKLQDRSISVAEGVRKRLESDVKNKKSTRLANFDNSRNLPESEPPVQEPQLNKIKQSRWLLLQKWKEEKQNEKLEALKKRKTPFVVGIPKNSKNCELPPAIIWPLPSTSGKVTRSQAARSNNMNNNKIEEENAFAPQNASFNPSLGGLYKPTLSTYGEKNYKTHKKQSTKVMSHNNDIILNQQPRCLRSKSTLNGQTTMKKTQNELNTHKKIQTYISKNKTLAKNIKTSKKEDHSISSEMLADAKLTLNKQNDNKKHFFTSTPNNVPKSESSSEEKRKREKLLSPQATDVPMTSRQINEELKKMSPCVDLSRGKENTRKKIKKRTDEGLLDEDVHDMRVEHFEKQLASEIKQMTEMCEVWDKILEQSTLPDEFQEAALAAVGQARLLMSRTLQRLASLLRRCERPEPGTALVSLADVQGFRDMAFLQIKDVHGRVKKLGLSRARGWASGGPLGVTRRPKPRPAPKRLKSIAASADTTTKTLEAGSFRVQWPVKKIKRAQLRSVLSSKVMSVSKKARRNNSYVMLRASLLGKNVTGDEAIFLHKVEENLITTDTKALGGEIENNRSSRLKAKLERQDAIEIDTPVETRSNKRSSRKLRSLHKFKENLITTGTEALGGEIENNRSSRLKAKLETHDAIEIDTPVETRSNKRSSRKLRSLHKVEENLITTYTKALGGEIENNRSSRLKAKLERQDAIEIDTPVETRSNKRSSRKLRSLHKVKENLITTYTKALGGEIENNRSSRLKAKLERQDAIEIDTPVETRSNKRSSRKLRSLHKVEENLITTDTEALGGEIENNRSSRLKAKLETHDAIEIDIPVETRSNKRSSRKLRSLHKVEENLITTYTEALGEEIENNRSSRLKAKFTNARCHRN